MGVISAHLRKHPEMTVAVSPDGCFAYTKIPKAAGTSVYRKTIQRDYPQAFTRKDNRRVYDKWLDALTDEMWGEYCTFTFTRNPWDRMVSIYQYFKFWKRYDFAQFIKDRMYLLSDRVAMHSVPQHIFAFRDGKQYVDFIGSVENIKDDWRHVSRKIGSRAELPTCNATKHLHYSAYYNDETRAMIGEEYAEDVKLFGYSFDAL